MSELNEYPIINDWRKGCYLARVTGPHSKYVYDREFVSGTGIKSRGTLEYKLGRDLEAAAPAWYVMRDAAGTTDLLAVSDLGWRVVASAVGAADVIDAFGMGAPGSEGAWDGARCKRCERPAAGRDFESVVCDKCEGSESHNAATADLEAPF